MRDDVSWREQGSGFGSLPTKGTAQAQANLGAMYENGQGVPPDYATAYMWFSLAGAGAQEGYLRVSFI